MNKPRPSVSISIVNWNGSDYISTCLRSVCGQDYENIEEIIVVDNASSDGSLEIVEREFPYVRIIKNDTNLGFCKAHNQAIGQASGDLLLLLNFDIVLEKNFLSSMVCSISADEKIGMVSGKLYRSFNGKKTGTLDSTGMLVINYFSAPRGDDEADSGQYDDLSHRYIFGPCGAAPLYRKEMLEDIKYEGEYFDEDFVNYVEDVDLAWRAQLRDWKAVYTPEAIAYHERGATRKSDKDEQIKYHIRGYRNRYLTIYKNAGTPEMLKVLHKFLVIEFFFLLGDFAISVHPKMKFRSLKEALDCKAKFKAKRNYVQENRTAQPDEISHFFGFDDFSIIAFIFGKIKHYFFGVPKEYLSDLLHDFSLGRLIIYRYKLAKRSLFRR